MGYLRDSFNQIKIFIWDKVIMIMDRSQFVRNMMRLVYAISVRYPGVVLSKKEMGMAMASFMIGAVIPLLLLR